MDQPFCSQELKAMFSIARKLLPCHRTLQEGFGRCTENNKSESDLPQYFFAAVSHTHNEYNLIIYMYAQEEELLEYGIYAAHLPEAQEKVRGRGSHLVSP